MFPIDRKTGAYRNRTCDSPVALQPATLFYARAAAHEDKTFENSCEADHVAESYLFSPVVTDLRNRARMEGKWLGTKRGTFFIYCAY